MTFESLGLSSPLCKALKACHYEEPTPIQEAAIPAALRGDDVLGIAQTGTGKTCAFGTPILQLLSTGERKKGKREVRALILTPTRELAMQIGDNLREYSKGMSLYSSVIFGGVGQGSQVERLRRGVDVVTATPGRLLDLHEQGLIDLSHVEILVLDEADRMLDMGFINDMKKIIAVLPKERQTLFFSATMPKEITELVNSLMQDPVRVEVTPASSTVEVIEQKLYFIDRKNKINLLADILQEDNSKNALIFTRTKHSADKVTRQLEERGIRAAAIHGNKSQSVRQQSLAQFKKGKVQALVATDIAARGIDIDSLPYVFNYNLPDVAETYVHRIGRTGRAGRQGVAIAFCDHAEKLLLRNIEKLLGKQIPRVDDHPYPLVVFENMRRDKKGRLVHPDDEEARQEAQLKRQQIREQTEKNRAKKLARATAPQDNKANTSRKAKPAKAGKPLVKKKSIDDLDMQTSSVQANTATKERRNPLAGDVIMDATARFLAPKSRTTTKRTQSGDRAQRDDRQPFAKQNKDQTSRTRQGEKPQRDAKPQAGRQERRRGKPNAPKTAENSPRFMQNKPAGKSAAKDAKSPRKYTRRAPQVQGLRSKQKDSTEQPSLMKPFYINND